MGMVVQSFLELGIAFWCLVPGWIWILILIIFGGIFFVSFLADKIF